MVDFEYAGDNGLLLHGNLSAVFVLTLQHFFLSYFSISVYRATLMDNAPSFRVRARNAFRPVTTFVAFDSDSSSCSGYVGPSDDALVYTTAALGKKYGIQAGVELRCCPKTYRET